MKYKFPLILIGLSATVLQSSAASAQFQNGIRWGQGEKRNLCRQSIALAGVEEDMDQRIRQIVRNAGRRDTSSRAFQEALDDTLNEAKEPILDQLLDSCAQTFTVSELRGINNFYSSPAGQAWLRKGRTSIMPAMERAIADIQPRISEEVERRYCERTGC